MDRSLTPSEVEHLYHLLTGKKINVILYDQIINASNLNPFFRHNNSFIIFYPAVQIQNNILGHYCSLTRLGNYYYFYDPMGYKPDEYKHFSDRNRMYKEQVNSLIQHFITSGLHVDYSHHKHQSRNPKIATCGRHCVMRCIFNGSNDEYNKRIRKQSGIKRGFLDNYVYYLTSP